MHKGGRSCASSSSSSSRKGSLQRRLLAVLELLHGEAAAAAAGRQGQQQQQQQPMPAPNSRAWQWPMQHMPACSAPQTIGFHTSHPPRERLQGPAVKSRLPPLLPPVPLPPCAPLPPLCAWLLSATIWKFSGSSAAAVGRMDAAMHGCITRSTGSAPMWPAHTTWPAPQVGGTRVA